MESVDSSAERQHVGVGVKSGENAALRANFARRDAYAEPPPRKMVLLLLALAVVSGPGLR